MDIYRTILNRRTIRQYQARPVGRDLLEKFVEAGRLAPSAANLQPLEFVVVDDPAVCGGVFPSLKWAAYIHPEGDPKPGREPRAYILVLVDTRIREKMFEYDVGAAVENMALAAEGEGVASCWLLSIDRPALQALLGIPETHRLDSVLALGYPAETSTVEPYLDSPRYWKDAAGGFHVPKRKLSDITHFNRF